MREDEPLARSVPAPFSTMSASVRSSRISRWSVAEPSPRSVPSTTTLPSTDATMLEITYGRPGGGEYGVVGRPYLAQASQAGLDATHVALVYYVRRDDLQHNGQSHLPGNAHGLALAAGQTGLNYGYAGLLNKLLGLHLGQHCPAILACFLKNISSCHGPPFCEATFGG